MGSLARTGYDRLPIKHFGEPEIDSVLKKHFGVTTYLELLEKLGDDFRTVEPRYVGPELKTYPDGSREGIWGETYKNISFGAGEYCESVVQPLKDVRDVEALHAYRWPSVQWYDFSTIRDQIRQYRGYAIVGGWCGHMDFINGIARMRGVEQVLLDIATEDPVYREIIDRRAAFFFDLFTALLRAGDGRIDIIHVGEDFGTQHGLLIGPETYRKLYRPKYQRLAEIVHAFGAKLMLHSCGSVRGLIHELIATGVDILDVVQVTAAGMDIAGLQRDFGDTLNFCGTVCVQTTLPFGTVADVRREVELRRRLFPAGGLFIGPTHAIQVGTPLENILALYRAAGGLGE
jgi:uroporphyrinogen decarboxylase